MMEQHLTVAVFKTDVSDHKKAALLIRMLKRSVASSRITFDLEDCDKVLRIEQGLPFVHKVVKTLERYGSTCSLLES